MKLYSAMIVLSWLAGHFLEVSAGECEGTSVRQAVQPLIDYVV